MSPNVWLFCAVCQTRILMEPAAKVGKLTNSVDHIPTEALKECYQNFLKAFEKYIEDKEVDNIDSKTVIKDFMRFDDKRILATK